MLTDTTHVIWVHREWMDRNKDGVWRVRGGSSDRNPIFMRRFGRVNISSAFNLAGTRPRLLAGGTHDCSNSRLFISQLSRAKCWKPPIHWLDFFSVLIRFGLNRGTVAWLQLRLAICRWPKIPRLPRAAPARWGTRGSRLIWLDRVPGLK